MQTLPKHPGGRLRGRLEGANAHGAQATALTSKTNTKLPARAVLRHHPGPIADQITVRKRLDQRRDAAAPLPDAACSDPDIWVHSAVRHAMLRNSVWRKTV